MKFPFLLSIFLLNVTLYSQDTLVRNASLPEAELHAAINPLDSNNIVLSVQHGASDPHGSFLSIYYTNDFGVTWHQSNYKGSLTNTSQAGDPVLSFDKSGNVLLVSLVVNSNDLNTILSRSTDGGATWSQVATIAKNSDKPWIAIDNFSASPNLGNIYIPVVVNNLTLYTLDSNYQKVDSLTIPNGDHLPSVVIKHDGTVFTSTVELSTDNTIYVQQYSNGGSNIVHSTFVVSFPDYTFNVPDISLRFQPTAYLAIDNSGGLYDGRLYLSYTASETTNPKYFNVFLIYSDDNGLTWSSPKIVHSNQQSQIQQFYSSIYVNNNGVLILDWYDRKNYSNTNKLTDFLMGVSHDGGTNFTEIQLNSVSSDWDFVVSSSSNFGIGEYHQLVATDNIAFCFWSDGRTNDGDLNVYMTKANIKDTIVNILEYGQISDKISVSLYPVPTKNVLNAKINLFERSKIKYEIYNASGQIIEISEWVNYPNGEQILSINLDFSNGYYYLKIISDKGYFKKMKFIKN